MCSSGIEAVMDPTEDKSVEMMIWVIGLSTWPSARLSRISPYWDIALILSSNVEQTGRMRRAIQSL